MEGGAVEVGGISFRIGIDLSAFDRDLGRAEQLARSRAAVIQQHFDSINMAGRASTSGRAADAAARAGQLPLPGMAHLPPPRQLLDVAPIERIRHVRTRDYHSTQTGTPEPVSPPTPVTHKRRIETRDVQSSIAAQQPPPVIIPTAPPAPPRRSQLVEVPTAGGQAAFVPSRLSPPTMTQRQMPPTVTGIPAASRTLVPIPASGLTDRPASVTAAVGAALTAAPASVPQMPAIGAALERHTAALAQEVTTQISRATESLKGQFVRFTAGAGAQLQGQVTSDRGGKLGVNVGGSTMRVARDRVIPQIPVATPEEAEEAPAARAPRSRKVVPPLVTPIRPALPRFGQPPRVHLEQAEEGAETRPAYVLASQGIFRTAVPAGTLSARARAAALVNYQSGGERVPPSEFPPYARYLEQQRQEQAALAARPAMVPTAPVQVAAPRVRPEHEYEFQRGSFATSIQTRGEGAILHQHREGDRPVASPISRSEAARQLLAQRSRVRSRLAPNLAYTEPARIPALAKGGNVQPGLPHLVGEQGPEIFVPKQAGFVLPNTEVKKLTRGRRQQSSGGDWQPDLFGGRGIEHGEGATRTEQLGFARQEMQATGSLDLFDAVPKAPIAQPHHEPRAEMEIGEPTPARDFGWTPQQTPQSDALFALHKLSSIRHRARGGPVAKVSYTRAQVTGLIERNALVSAAAIGAKHLGAAPFQLPEYLHPAKQFFTQQAEQLARGRLTEHQVATAYLTTLSSIKGGEHPRDTAEGHAGTPYPESVISMLGGKQKVRPEDAFANWLQTSQGQQVLEQIRAGDTVRAGEAIEAARLRHMPNFGMPSFKGKGGSRPAIDLPKAGQFNLSNIARATEELNRAGLSGAAIEPIARQFVGIGSGKTGFLAGWLGSTQFPVLDSNAVQMWLGGGADLSHAVLKAVNVPGTSLGTRLQQAVIGRHREMQGLGYLPGVPEEQLPGLMHWTLFDAKKHAETSHRPIISALTQAGRARQAGGPVLPAGIRAGGPLEAGRRGWAAFGDHPEAIRMRGQLLPSGEFKRLTFDPQAELAGRQLRMQQSMPGLFPSASRPGSLSAGFAAQQAWHEIAPNGEHNQQQAFYELAVDPRSRRGHVRMIHTPRDMRGQGVAGRMYADIAEQAKANNWRIFSGHQRLAGAQSALEGAAGRGDVGVVRHPAAMSLQNFDYSKSVPFLDELVPARQQRAAGGLVDVTSQISKPRRARATPLAKSLRSNAAAKLAQKNPYLLATAPAAGLIPLSADEALAHYQDLETQHEEVRKQIEHLDTQLAGGAFAKGRARSAIVRPSWAVGMAESDLVAIAQHYGLNPNAVDWGEGLSPEDRLVRSGPKSAPVGTASKARAQLRELRVRLGHLQAAGEHMMAQGDATFYKPIPRAAPAALPWAGDPEPALVVTPPVTIPPVALPAVAPIEQQRVATIADSPESARTWPNPPWMARTFSGVPPVVRQPEIQPRPVRLAAEQVNRTTAEAAARYQSVLQQARQGAGQLSQAEEDRVFLAQHGLIGAQLRANQPVQTPPPPAVTPAPVAASRPAFINAAMPPRVPLVAPPVAAPMAAPAAANIDPEARLAIEYLQARHGQPGMGDLMRTFLEQGTSLDALPGMLQHLKIKRAEAEETVRELRTNVAVGLGGAAGGGAPTHTPEPLQFPPRDFVRRSPLEPPQIAQTVGQQVLQHLLQDKQISVTHGIVRAALQSGVPLTEIPNFLQVMGMQAKESESVVRQLRGVVAPSTQQPQRGLLSRLLRRESGGEADGSAPYLVGERGPELFVPHAAGYVLAADQTRRAFAEGRIGGVRPRALGGPVTPVTRAVAGAIAVKVGDVLTGGYAGVTAATDAERLKAQQNEFEGLRKMVAGYENLIGVRRTDAEQSARQNAATLILSRQTAALTTHYELLGDSAAEAGKKAAEQAEAHVGAITGLGDGAGGGGGRGGRGTRIFGQTPTQFIRDIAAFTGVNLGLNVVSGALRLIHQLLADAVEESNKLALSGGALGAAYGPVRAQAQAAGFQQFQAAPLVAQTQTSYQQTAAQLAPVAAQFNLTDQVIQQVNTDSAQLAQIWGGTQAQAAQALTQIMRGQLQAGEQYNLNLIDQHGNIRGLAASYTDLVNRAGPAAAVQAALAVAQQSVNEKVSNFNATAGEQAQQLVKLDQSWAGFQTRLAQLVSGPATAVLTDLGNGLERINQAIGAAPPKPANTAPAPVQQFTAPAPIDPSQFRARAQGGETSIPGAYLVGERGPELFVPKTAGYVYSHDKTVRILGARADEGEVHPEGTLAPSPNRQIQPSRFSSQYATEGDAAAAGAGAAGAAIGSVGSWAGSAIERATGSAVTAPAILAAAPVAIPAAAVLGIGQKVAPNITGMAVRAGEQFVGAKVGEAAGAAAPVLTDLLAATGPALKGFTAGIRTVTDLLPEPLKNAADTVLGFADGVADATQSVVKAAQDLAVRPPGQPARQSVAADRQDRSDATVASRVVPPTARENQVEQAKLLQTQAGQQQAVAAAQQNRISAESKLRALDVDKLAVTVDGQRVSAAQALNRFSAEHLAIESQTIPLALTQQRIADQIAIKTQPDLELRRGSIQAQQAAIQPAAAVEQLGFENEQARLRLQVGLQDRMAGREPTYNMQDQLQTIYKTSPFFQAPQRLADLEAGHAVRQTGFAETASQLGKAGSVIDLQQQQQVNDRAMLMYQEQLAAADASGKLVTNMLAFADILAGPDRIAAEKDFTVAAADIAAAAEVIAKAGTFPEGTGAVPISPTLGQVPPIGSLGGGLAPAGLLTGQPSQPGQDMMDMLALSRETLSTGGQQSGDITVHVHVGDVSMMQAMDVDTLTRFISDAAITGTLDALHQAGATTVTRVSPQVAAGR